MFFFIATVIFFFFLQPEIPKKYFPDGKSTNSATEVIKDNLRLSLQFVRVCSFYILIFVLLFIGIHL